MPKSFFILHNNDDNPKSYIQSVPPSPNQLNVEQSPTPVAIDTFLYVVYHWVAFNIAITKVQQQYITMNENNNKYVVNTAILGVIVARHARNSSSPAVYSSFSIIFSS